MTVKVRQKTDKMIVIRTNSSRETEFILKQLARIKWMPQQLAGRPMRPEITVKDMDGHEVIIPKPKPSPEQIKKLKEAQKTKKIDVKIEGGKKDVGDNSN